MNALSIAFQGAPGAFSHAAAREFAARLGCSPDETRYLPCQTFGDVFASVTGGTATYGAIPLENSSIGSIVANYDLLWENDAFIVAEQSLPVHHQLIGFAGASPASVRVVFSHPAALDQCRKLFKRHPNMVARVHWDTSGSVMHVKESGDTSWAAIAGTLAAVEYGMAILEENVEDFASNATRFGLITGAEQRELFQQTCELSESGRSITKESFAVELEHKPGALASLLGAIASSGANLTKIESRPIGDTPWHYRFFMDIEVSTGKMESELDRLLSSATVSYKLLGRYLSQCEAGQK